MYTIPASARSAVAPSIQMASILLVYWPEAPFQSNHFKLCHFDRSISRLYREILDSEWRELLLYQQFQTLSLIPQGINRIQVGRLPSRVDPEDQPDRA